jgi:hypothetical protein
LGDDVGLWRAQNGMEDTGEGGDCADCGR